MSLQLPPSGTRGAGMSKFAQRTMKMTSGIGTVMFRLGVKVQGRQLLVLTTIGARSGQERRTVLGWFPDEADSRSVIVVGSAAGAARHPAWAHNLAANPDQVTIDTGDGPVPVDVELLSGSERESTWQRIVELAPGYGSYEDKTDREMPIFRLEPQT